MRFCTCNKSGFKKPSDFMKFIVELWESMKSTESHISDGTTPHFINKVQCGKCYLLQICQSKAE